MIIGQAGEGVFIDDLVHRPAEDDGYLGELSRMRLEVELLRSENAKLRELLAETLMPYRDYAKKYGIAPYLADVNEHLDARLRELGVEV